MDIKTVHLVFKTHLDIGFTDLAANVVERYFNSFIPGSLALAEQMHRRGGTERFIWTTGSWLIYEYLEQAGPAERRRMEEAIERGDIAWHGLPFTTMTEAEDADLFRFGLSLSRSLDARYGRTTIAAKMTDVPGHTRAIVPLMAEAGLQLLHIGVNPASSAPDVPPAFVWRSPDGAEIPVLYSAGSYGTLHLIEGLEDALLISLTNDNLGPPPLEAILGVYDQMREQFPGAEVKASTLDAFAHKLATVKSSLPVVTGELGDSWIYGIGSDPKKISRYRELLRLAQAWRARGVDPAALRTLNRSLALVPEHTWGMDEKVHLGDYVNYATADFAAARERDLVDTLDVPEAYVRYSFWARPDNTYSRFESSWQEQRAYVSRAVDELEDKALRAEAAERLAMVEPRLPDKDGYEPLDPAGVIKTPHYIVGLDPDTGGITRLEQREPSRTLAAPDHVLGLFRYESFSQADYDRWMHDYAINLEDNAGWAYADFTKPGMDAARPRPEHRMYEPRLIAAMQRPTDDGHDLLLELAMPEACATLLGAPRKLTIEYAFREQHIDIRLQWFGKQACRLPEAAWFSFKPMVTTPENWTMDKMGQAISPLDVVRHGGRTLHAIGRGVEIRDASGYLAIDSLDAPLVAPGAPRLLHFEDSQPSLQDGMHFNLHNNLWGTNFPMWFEEDALFRFTLRLLPTRRNHV